MATYGLAPAPPGAGEAVPIKGQEFWDSFLGTRAGFAVGEPVRGAYYVVDPPSCCSWGGLRRASASEVERTLPAALEAHSARSFADHRRVFRLEFQAEVRDRLAAEFAGQRPDASSLIAAYHRHSEEAVRALPSGGEEWEAERTRWKGIVIRRRELSGELAWDLWAGPLWVLLDLALWSWLALWLFGSKLPGAVSPGRVALRVGTWPLGVAVCLGLCSLLGPRIGAWGQPFPLSAGQAYGSLLRTEVVIACVVLGFACAGVASLSAWAWRSFLPKTGFGRFVEATLLAIPALVPLYLIALWIGAEEFISDHDLAPVLSWDMSLAGTIWFGLTLCAWALRSYLDPMRPPPAERSAPEGPPVTMGVHSSAEG